MSEILEVIRLIRQPNVVLISQKHTQKFWQLISTYVFTNYATHLARILGFVSSKQTVSNCTCSFEKRETLSRCDSTVINRLKIGHNQTHSFISTGMWITTGMCCMSNVHDSSAFLLDCPQLAATRLKYFWVTMQKDLFEQVDLTKIIDYCKDIQLYNYQ